MDKIWKYKLDEDRIQNLNETNLILNLVKCPICLDLLWDPQACSNCQQKICNYCLSDYIQNQYSISPKCPFKCNNVIKIRPDIILFQLLDLFQFKCFYHADGCPEIIKYDNISKHEQNCEYRRIQCQFCQNFIQNSEKKNHNCEQQNIENQEIHAFSNIYKSNNIQLSENNKQLQLFLQDGSFHVAFGSKKMTLGIHKWKLFFNSNNPTGVGMVAGILEQYLTPKVFSFQRFVDIYQEYNLHACTVWNQLWFGSKNDVTKSFYDNRWDNKWWHYELNFDNQKFTIYCPDQVAHNFDINKNGIYRIYIEVGIQDNTFILEEE